MARFSSPREKKVRSRSRARICAFDDLHPGFDLGAVARLARAARNDGGPIEPGHVQIGLVHVRVVPAGPWSRRSSDCRARGSRSPRPGARRCGCASRSSRAVAGCAWLPRRGSDSLPAWRRRSGPVDLAARRIRHRHGHAGVVNEQLLAGRIGLAHAHIDRLGPTPVQFAELAVAVAVRIDSLGILPTAASALRLCAAAPCGSAATREPGGSDPDPGSPAAGTAAHPAPLRSAPAAAANSEPGRPQAAPGSRPPCCARSCNCAQSAGCSAPRPSASLLH